MKYFLILFVGSAFTNIISCKSHCHACFDSICYTKAAILQNYSISGQLAVDRTANVVYFNYNDDKPGEHSVAFDLHNRKILYIPDIQFSVARAIDQSTRDVYIGDKNGIYKYSPITNETTRFGLFDKFIWHMQFKDKIYYTVFMTKGLYTFEKNKNQSDAIAELKDFIIEDFIVDKRDDIYFMSNFTLHTLKKGENRATIFSNVIYSLATDIYDNAYFVQRENRGLYKIDYRNGKLKEMGAFESGSPITTVFDNQNNIINYDANSDKLFYMTPNYGRCEVTNEGIEKTHKIQLSSFLTVDQEMTIKSRQYS